MPDTDGLTPLENTFCESEIKVFLATPTQRIDAPLPYGQATHHMLHIDQATQNNLDTLAFEDVSYFATTSAMRLVQISEVLSAYETGEISRERLTGSAGMLAGMCRSVNETLDQLRKIAEKRLANAPAVTLCDYPTAPRYPTLEIDSALSTVMRVFAPPPMADTLRDLN